LQQLLIGVGEICGPRRYLAFRFLVGLQQVFPILPDLCHQGKPMQEPYKDQVEANQKTSDLFQQSLGASVSYHHVTVQTFKVIGDIDEAAEEDESEPGQDMRPPLQLMELVPSSDPKQVTDDQGHDEGSDAF
jgi:hypothetical protein